MSVKVESLTKIYDTQKAVDNVSFELAKGEIVGFLGPNGAGKSTTMKIITTYLPATAGMVSVCGFNVQDDPMEVRRRVGYLPESNPLYYEMYVREYLEFTAGIHKLGGKTKGRIEEMIALTGLTKESTKKIGALSKGYKQRVGLAQAMLHDPDVLILDEPTSGLDPNQIIEIRDLIKNSAKEKTVLLSTHIMQEVQAMCSRVIIINSGKIVADDNIEHLKTMNMEQGVLLVVFEGSVDAGLFSGLQHAAGFENLGAGKYRFATNAPDALRKEIMQLSVNHDLKINSLQAESQSLEDVFRNLTQ